MKSYSSLFYRKAEIMKFRTVLVFALFFAGTGVFGETLPSPGDYCTIQNGHLTYRGKRLRIWGSQGNMLADNYRWIDAEVKRFADLGFTGYRTMWWEIDIDKWNYKKGDNSGPDRSDYLLADLWKHGIRVWADMPNSALVRPEHVDLVNDPATRTQWLKALGDKPVRTPLYIVWDARAEAGYLDDIKKILNHVNQHTGLRWADDPVFYVWGINNEQWWLQRILNYANHLSLPEYFQKELYRQWNTWLKKKYGTDARLHDEWIGSLLPGESLEKSTIQLLPLFCPAGGAAEAMGIDAKNFKGSKFTLRDFSRKRGADVMEFLTGLLLEHKKRVYAAMRSVGKPGIGISVVPIIFDTGYSFSPQSVYVNSFGDALCVCTYVSQITLDPKHPRYPFKSLLEEAPSLSYDDPWLEQNRLVDKPTFVYENMVLMPDKYRCEYPYLLVALGAIQDWDVINFHDYGHPQPDILTGTQPFNKMLQPNNGFSCAGLQYKWDEVLNSSMRVAGEMFKNFALTPPENPTVMTVGRETLWDMDLFEWGDLAKMFAPTVDRYGLRLKFDPNLPEKAKVAGPVVHGRQFLPPEIDPTDQINLNWHKGVLHLDTPQAKAAAGFLPEKVSFKDGVEISNFKINIPKDLPYYKPDEDRFVCFGLSATDGKPLGASKRILLSAMCGAFNKGMEMNTKKWPAGNQYGRLNDFAEWGFPVCEQFGSLPVLVARVGLTVKAPMLAGRSFVVKDWHLKEIRKGTISADGLLNILEIEPAFIVEIIKAQ
jgi:hypothetical protein